jgi:hypothetical protein
MRTPIATGIDRVGLIDCSALPSTGMEPTAITKNTKPTNNQTSEPARPVEVTNKSADAKPAEISGQHGDPKATDVVPTHGPAKAPKSSRRDEEGSRAGKRIVSVALPEKLARALRLLSASSGQPVQSILETAIRKQVSRQLVASLDSLKSELSE